MTKKIVHYDDMKPVLEYGGGVILFPIDHWNVSLVSNTSEAWTSKVVSWDKETGVIETQNTIYKPISTREFN